MTHAPEPMFGIPVAPDDPRTLPLDPVPFPARLSGFTVIAATLIPARQGECGNLACMILRDDSRPALRAYGVVTGRADSGAWSAGDGTWDCSYVNAAEIFMERLKYRL